MKLAFISRNLSVRMNGKNIVRTGVSAEGQRVFDVSVNGEKLIRFIESG